MVAAGAAVAEPPTGDAERGKVVFKVCAACHAIGQGAKNRIGPHLNGVFGRQAGGIDGFRYSDGLKRAGVTGLVWDYESLDAYIENPKALVSHTRMNFPGMADAIDRAHVLAYLRRFSDNPANIPEAPPRHPPSPKLPPEVLQIKGDPAFGEYLASECTTCHRADGEHHGIPSITHWPVDDFVVAMHAYKQEIRANPVMRMIAGRLSDDEIASLAAYFADIE
ncbi:c-type cytochrome [Roseospirillum parvum]|uniref:Cytochrome c n=1 Tax=Roseospirillum parvum TaxID=83401 RepID=A0A1G8AL17_9PROT|nr:c-type cytochrome [Roseospirillum parvum]SDH21654.1 cytochrome c [Roseospirillum parvum]